MLVAYQSVRHFACSYQYKAFWAYVTPFTAPFDTAASQIEKDNSNFHVLVPLCRTVIQPLWLPVESPSTIAACTFLQTRGSVYCFLIISPFFSNELYSAWSPVFLQVWIYVFSTKVATLWICEMSIAACRYFFSEGVPVCHTTTRPIFVSPLLHWCSESGFSLFLISVITTQWEGFFDLKHYL